MLSALFRPKWQHKDHQVRLNAVKQLATEKNLAILEKIALSDSELAIRQAAIGGIKSLASLMQLYQQTSFNNDKAFVQQCYVACLSDDAITPALQAEQIVLDCKDSKWLAAIAHLSPNHSLKQLALTGLRDDDTILQLLTETRDSQLWQLAAQQLSSEGALKKAINLVKGRDKKTSQLIRQKLAQFEQQQQQTQAVQQQATHIIDKLQHVLAAEHTPLLEGILLNLQQQITAFSNDNALFQQMQDLYQTCYNKLQQQKVLQQQQQSAQQTLQHAQALLQQLNKEASYDDELLQSRQALQQQSADYEALQPVLAQIDQLIDAITQFSSLLAELQQVTAFDNLHYRDCETQLALTHKALQLCQKHSALAHHHKHALQAREQRIQERITQLKKAQKNTEKQLNTLVQQADDAIANRDFSKLTTLFHQVKKQLSLLDSQQAKRYQMAVSRMQAANDTLKDWQEFATDPKREALCDAMQQLIHAELHAKEKANAIKQLQQQWKALGYCKDQALWQRFHDVAEQAYAPCKHYFAEQKSYKQFNAEQCTVICEQVESFAAQLDWNQVDYRSLDKLLRQIHQEWQRYSFTEQKDFKPLQQRYLHAVEPLKAQLIKIKQRHTEQLTQLVEKAKVLLENHDSDAALSQYQALHEQWKAIGISFHKQQQALWQELREVGDALYQKRQQQRQEAEDELQANAQQAQQLIHAITQCQQQADLDALKQQFEQLGSFPKNQYKKIQADYHAAVKALHQRVYRQQQQAFYQQIRELLSWSEHCAAQEAQAQTANSPLNATLPHEWQEALNLRLHAPQAASAQQLSTLCIEAELLADIASPESDTNARMAIQMQQLQAHFGNANKEHDKHAMIDLVLRWCSLPIGLTPEYSCYTARFNQALTQLMAH